MPGIWKLYLCFSFPATNLLITTGSKYSAGMNKSELVDVKSDETLCPDFEDYPLEVAHATGALLQGKGELPLMQSNIQCLA